MTTVLEVFQTLPGGGLLVRMALVAVFVIAVAVTAERLGPFLGGMFASLPLYTGPIYLMLALEHDADYIAAATLGSIAICGGTPIFVFAYCMVARRLSALASLATALGVWGLFAAALQATSWALVDALLFVAPIYLVSVPLARGFTRGVALQAAGRGRYDLALRALLCGGLAGIVITLSAVMPAQLTGILSVMPILLTSLILVLHPRIGGAATAALLAHTLGGLIGMVLGFALVNQMIPLLGVWPALGLGLTTTIVWNMGVITMRALAKGRLRAHAPGAIAAATPSVPPPRAMPPPLPPAWPRRR